MSVTGCGGTDNSGDGSEGDAAGGASSTASGSTDGANTTANTTTDTASASATAGTTSAGATTTAAQTSGSDSTGATATTGSAEGGLALVDLPTAYGTAYCSWLYRCCPSAQIDHLAEGVVSFYGTTEAECQTNMTALTLLLVPSISEGESQGRARYDEFLAAACMDTLSTSCGDIDSACQTVVEPLVAPGGACSENNQCTGDLSCINDTDTADGTCAALLGLGAVCERDGDCASDVCSGTCVNPGAQGASCFDDSACASAYCDFGTNTCAEAPYSGACEL